MSVDPARDPFASLRMTETMWRTLILVHGIRHYDTHKQQVASAGGWWQTRTGKYIYVSEIAFTTQEQSTAKTLVVSYVGMVTQEVAIKQNVKVILESDVEHLDEVMVVAFGTAKKASHSSMYSV